MCKYKTKESFSILKVLPQLAIVLMLFTVSSSAFARPAPFVSLTGTWEVFSTNAIDNSTVKGTLKIQHNLSTGFVTATSTSGGSRWTGNFSQSDRLLRADFKNGQIQGKIYLKFNYGYAYRQPDELKGKWFANTKDKGTYKAVRMK